MKSLWNKSLPMLLSLLLFLMVIHPMSVLARQQKYKSVKITDMKISKIVNKEYTGKKQTQRLVIMNGSYKLKLNTDYTISYKKNIEIGTASVTIKGKGMYTGSVIRTFQINPAKTVLINAVLDGSSALLMWEKNTGSDRYQIYYTKEKNGKFVRLSTVDKTKTSYIVKNVTEGTWYYKVRAYKNVNSKKYYGKFSDVKSVTYKSTTSSQPTQTVPTQPEEKIDTIAVKVGNTTFTAILEENDTTKAFIAQLPLTLSMSELNGNEKYNFLSRNLRADTATSPSIIKEGDLMLYGDNCLVLFYETFNTSFSYVKLGHIDNTTGLAEAVGSGSVQVTFSVSD